jgi:hypothetical protein
LEILRQFAYGFTIPLLWSMMSELADRSEWKNKRRATGIVFSAIVFALKAGLRIVSRCTRLSYDIIQVSKRAPRGRVGKSRMEENVNFHLTFELFMYRFEPVQSCQTSSAGFPTEFSFISVLLPFNVGLSPDVNQRR